MLLATHTSAATCTYLHWWFDVVFDKTVVRKPHSQYPVFFDHGLIKKTTDKTHFSLTQSSEGLTSTGMLHSTQFHS